jgi:hypothetical protein
MHYVTVPPPVLLGARKNLNERHVADDVSLELGTDAAGQPAQRNARMRGTDPIGGTRRHRRRGRRRAPRVRPAAGARGARRGQCHYPKRNYPDPADHRGPPRSHHSFTSVLSQAPLRRLGRPAPPDHRSLPLRNGHIERYLRSLPADHSGWPAPPAVLLSMTPPDPQHRRTAGVPSGYAIRQGRGAGAVTPGSFLRSFTRETCGWLRR